MPWYEAGFGSGRFLPASVPDASPSPEPPPVLLALLPPPLGDLDSSSFPEPSGSSEPMTPRTTIAPTTDAATISPVRFFLGC